MLLFCFLLASLMLFFFQSFTAKMSSVKRTMYSIMRNVHLIAWKLPVTFQREIAVPFIQGRLFFIRQLIPNFIFPAYAISWLIQMSVSCINMLTSSLSSRRTDKNIAERFLLGKIFYFKKYSIIFNLWLKFNY